jgi:diguanylate cyclase
MLKADNLIPFINSVKNTEGVCLMPFTKKEIDRTIANGEIALGHIKSRKFSAQPRNYEVWYTYVSGFYDNLSNALNSIIEKKGTVAQEDIDMLYEQYLSPTRLSNEIDRVGAQVVGEIEQMMKMVDESAIQTGSSRKQLGSVGKELKEEATPERLRAAVRKLQKITDEAAKNNKVLEEHLLTTREQMVQLQAHLEIVRTESFTDPLTALFNRKYFDAAIVRTIEEASEKDQPMSLLVCDIDHFKKFNDNFGHLTGDQVLRLVANALKQNVKGQDLPCRYGGEEFMIILPDTSMRAAVAAAENIRRAVMTKELVRRTTGENLGRITMSVGVATLHRGDTVHSLIERADKCLYAAKGAGRNRVLCETDPEIEDMKRTNEKVA